ncbi:liprin-beta-2b isoform X1 [Anabas testudineus]|uniref:liprin-beta-2b isoform X1 n=2 Tax=Anabas testudineus TaxID=64144 RepID=UPI000E453DCD|nr:liprin-beta-2b isoform X1 [Anabas testudineus]XP_026221553.1 liprin-beta-2b isoform X1 [Anabas testudineus]XP_026221554.1 liprin-beta-2b isoform X1 [Anabas testudineus]XP_026221556.1 liprin-beta-2b isoform X1 [Anabas testudineus]XP_026221557.1 liprin-beta-2b isoform X1 [Anabas testudineus]XP_026221558.1 liprin-beta-2b isoform X1 [Anabas testudineus]
MLPAITMETEASHMLEAALEQMDDIIAGSKAAAVEFSNSMYDLGSPISAGPLHVVQLSEDLKLALELQPSQEERDSLRAQIPTETAQALIDWLQSGAVNLCSPANNETYQERLLRLEGDKESLVLQVSVLTDQVEAQGEKIRDLESSLENHRQKLASTEEMLQQELMSRTSLETQKLDLMDEVSCLKLKLVSMEDLHSSAQPQEAVDTKQNKAECVVNFISELQEQMCRFQEEISTRIQEKRALEEMEAQQGEPRGSQTQGSSPQTGLACSDLSMSDTDGWTYNGGQTVHDLLQEVKQLKNKVDELEGEKSQYERKLRATKSLMTQLSNLKLTVEHTQLEKQHWEEHWRSAQAEISELQQLLTSKDAEIECLQTQLLAKGGTANDNAERDQEYQRLKVGMETLLASNDEKDRRIEELTILLGQYRNMREVMALTQGSSEEELSGSLKLRAITHKAHSDILRSEMSSRGSSPLMLSSSPYQRQMDASIHNSMDTSLVSTGDTSFFNGSWHQRRLLSSSLEELQSGSLQKVVEIQQVESESDVGAESPHMELSRYQTLPGKLSKKSEQRTELNGDGAREGEYLSPVQLSPVHSHDQEYSLRRTDKLEECILSDQSPLSSGVDSGQQSPVSPENRKTHRGIKKLWGRIRRSQSGSPVQVHDPELGDFKRGGFRATAGPRLARSGNTRDLKIPISKWSEEQVCDWLEDIGLGQYSILARHWVTSGQTLVSASPQDLEKEMAMKNPLHRKKLQLAIKTFSSKQPEKSAELDYIWVNRWLDDIGLPQYKDQFNDGRVDGQMLQYLTVNDLLFLKVTSQLHHLSIKCAIHVLHVNKFNPNCLKRRPSNESQFTPSEVVQWSNHRVMEWLRSVDLAEYAPNLRGSGVHGGLIMLEPRFNSDTLAMLLNIPPQKTLLRRHLTTNFNSLVGAQAQQEKREYIEAAGYTPLSITAKVKPKKLGFSNLTHLRRRRSDESTDYVCPIESSSPPSGQSVVNGVQMRPYAGFRGLSPILDREPDHSRDQVGLDDSRADPSP